MSELKGKMTTGQTMKGTASAAPYIPERMAHKLTFTGAVEAAYDGSSDVSVEIPKGGGTVTPEDVAAAVEAYMAEHPAEENDPTVPAWAKAKDKPSYTAQEVGALPADTKIPVVPTKVSAFENDKGYLTEHQDLSGYAKSEDIPTVPTTLPNPHKLTFTGAVNAEYDGSEAVEVVIPQGGGSGGGGERIVVNDTVLASGTVPADLAAWKAFYEGPITIGDLRKWKRFVLAVVFGSEATLNTSAKLFGVGHTIANTSKSAKQHYMLFEWADSNKTILDVMAISGDAAISVRDLYCATRVENNDLIPVSIGTSPNRTIVWKIFESEFDQAVFFAFVNKAQTVEGAWTLHGLFKYEEE